MSLPISFGFAVILGLLLVAHAFPVVILRAKLGHSFGDGDDPRLHRAIRAHANLAEYAPMFLLLLAMLEVGGTDALYLKALGAVFLFSRLVYVAYFFGAQVLPLRIVAFWGTVLPITAAAGFLALRVAG